MDKQQSSWALIGLCTFMAVITVAIEPSFSTSTDTLRLSQPPSLNHLLGTDHLGRSVAWRLLFATRAFAYPTLIAMVVASLIAVPTAALAGYYDGWPRRTYLAIHGVVSAIPRFVLILLILSLYSTSTTVLAIAIGVAYTPALSEAIYDHVKTLRAAPWVRAHFAWGFSHSTILWKFIVFRACRTLFTRHMANIFAYVLVVESTLSYLGSYGVQEPNPSLGNMMSFSWGYQSGNPMAFAAPTLLLFALVLAAHTISASRRTQ